MKRIVSWIMLTLILVLASELFQELHFAPVFASSSAEVHRFRLLAVERQYDSCNMRSAQFLIEELLGYQNWNNSTEEYVGYIHLLSMYPYEEVDDECKPFLRGMATKENLENEIKGFLAQATAGEIVIFYYCGHGASRYLVLDQLVSDTELVNWLSSGGLTKASLVVVLDTCHAGSWINDGRGGVLGSNHTVLAACMSYQSSWGWCDWWSWFTYIGIIEGFRFTEDSDNDGWISAAEVFTYAKPATQNYSLEMGSYQSPINYYDQFEGDIPLVQRDITRPFPERDLAIISLKIEQESIIAGFPLPITLTLKNTGVKMAIFNVKLYSNLTLIDVETVDLEPDENVTITFVWDTAGVPIGIYDIKAVIPIAPGETKIDDNILEGSVTVTPPLRDISLISLTCSVNEAYQGWIVDISITAKNEGEFTETFNVTLYYDDNLIEQRTIFDLSPEENLTIVFHWNTENVLPCHNYSIIAKLSSVPYERDLDDNVLLYAPVKIKLMGDINGDGRVDLFDAAEFANAVASSPGHPRWNPKADFDRNDIIDVFDAVLLSQKAGDVCSLS